MYDVIVIGCGITGAAISYELSKYDLKVAILEKENDISTGATKANSGIIHAGYDPVPGSLMAKLNVRGSHLAKEVCEKLDVPYKQCGAMVLAFNEEQKKTLENLYEQGEKNGVKNQVIIDGKGALELEPNLSKDVKWALLEQDSAIISPWEFCFALAETSIKNGVELFLDTEVTKIEKENSVWKINDKFETKIVINAAGIDAEVVHDLACPHSFDMSPKKGEYYLLDKEEGVRVFRTIFRAPDSNGKGVLVSPTVHGNLIVGPNSDLADGHDTSTTSEGLEFVKDKADDSVPSINFAANIRNFAGVRARTNVKDFIIEEVLDNGAHTGFIDVAGICSPGLSSALAIGEYVLQIIKDAKDSLHVSLNKKDNFIDTRKKIRFKELTEEEKAKLIKENPSYGRVVCRCETVTEGEILACFNEPIPPKSLDGIKRRTNTGMGRCQGGFCAPAIVPIIAEKLGVEPTEVLQELEGTKILTGGKLHV